MRIKTILAITALLASSALGATKVTIDSSDNVVVNGKTTFPISLAVLPPVNGKTPEGKSAWQEFADAGVNFARVAPGDYWHKHDWNDEGLDVARKYMDQMAPAHIYVWMTLGVDVSYIKPSNKREQTKLKKIVEMFKDLPALGAWKGADEPQWGNMNTHGKRPPSSIALTYKMLHKLDPDHPVIVIQAPRGTVAANAAYDPYLDITGMDVFPVSYPPGGHVAKWPNKDISAVGDWTKIIVEAAHGKPVWMTLQIAFSGTSKPGKTLRFPTFTQERFMTYEAIIDGARGINYFGGGKNVIQTLNKRDAKLGYNWTFWDRILKPVLEEINDKSPLHEALIAPNSKLPVKVSGSGMEFTVRETGDELYILACKREGPTEQVTFSGLSTGLSEGDVLYEAPRTVQAKDGHFTDWFGPHDVHVYRFKKR